VGLNGASLRFLAGFAAIWCALHVAGSGALTAQRGIATLLATALVAAGVERALFGTPRNGLVRRLGFGRPSAAAMAISLAVSAACLGVYPLLALLTGHVAVLRDGWPWLLAGVFAFNGLAEELGWRAYVFGHLREGRSFGRAAMLTMPLLAATHVPIAVTSGPVVGIGAMLVAAVTTLPFARLYELGRRTIWAPAVLHTAIDTFKLVTVPTEAQPTLSMLLVAVSLIVPLAVLPASRLTAARIRARAARDSSSAAVADRAAVSRKPTPATLPTTMQGTHR
jgi:membrane protease YdiL (CAAX protease family)